jgi:glyoxylase-like metal-dependent hydrolase (beta-lactamase superfamily II)
MKRAVLVAILVAVGGLSAGAVALQQQQQKPLNVRAIEKMRDNLYFISGGELNERDTWTGGNSMVLVGEKGVVLVDTMLPGAGRGILAQIKSVTDKPVTMIINTHTHFDHTGSNTEFPATIEYVAHEGTRANLAREKCEPVTNCAAFQGENKKFLPKRTFKDKLTLFSGKDQIDLYHFGRGHTNGDTFVVFPAHRAMHGGDMFPRQQMPFIDVANSGGSAVEMGSTLQKAVAGIKNVDTVVGGHTFTPVSWNDFKTYVDFYNEFLTDAQAAKKKGTSVDEFAKAYKVADKYKGFRADANSVRANADAIFAGK